MPTARIAHSAALGDKILISLPEALEARLETARRVVVVLPAHNEAKAIGQVIAAIPRSIEGMDVVCLAIDDGSTDETARVAAAAGSRVVRHLTNLGVGAATRTGFRAARSLGASFVVTMDSDGQHDPADIGRLVAAVIEGGHDVVIGTRMMRPKGMPPSRILANWLLNAITLVVYRGTVSDSQSGFKCLTREALERMELKADRYDICSEIVGEIFAKQLSYGSVPVKAVYTSYSRAKGQHFLNGVNLILQLFSRMLRGV